MMSEIIYDFRGKVKTTDKDQIYTHQGTLFVILFLVTLFNKIFKTVERCQLHMHIHVHQMAKQTKGISVMFMRKQPKNQ